MSENSKMTFEGETYRDTLTCFLTETAASLLENAFERDSLLQKTYEDYLARETKSEEPFLLYEASFVDDDKVKLFALPEKDEFYAEFSAPFFEATVSLAYDFTHMAVELCKIERFSGNPSHTLTWTHRVRQTLDDMLAADFQQEGNE